MPAPALQRPTKPLERMKQDELMKLARDINSLGLKDVRKIDFTQQTPSKALRNKIKGAMRAVEQQGALATGSA